MLVLDQCCTLRPACEADDASRCATGQIDPGPGAVQATPPGPTNSHGAVPIKLRSTSHAFAYLPSPKATSAPAVGSTTWWSGFWNTKPAGCAVATAPASGCSSPPATRSSVLLPHLRWKGTHPFTQALPPGFTEHSAVCMHLLKTTRHHDEAADRGAPISAQQHVQLAGRHREVAVPQHLHVARQHCGGRTLHAGFTLAGTAQHTLQGALQEPHWQTKLNLFSLLAAANGDADVPHVDSQTLCCVGLPRVSHCVRCCCLPSCAALGIRAGKRCSTVGRLAAAAAGWFARQPFSLRCARAATCVSPWQLGPAPDSAWQHPSARTHQARRQEDVARQQS